MSDDVSWQPLPERSVARPSREERAAAVARLESWAIDHGARFDAVEAVVDADGDVTLRARRAIAAGEAIITIPRALVIVKGRRELVDWLARAVLDGDSRWRPFLDVLPVAFPDIPMFRGGADLDALAGTLTRRIAAREHARILGGHAMHDLPLADYAWARAVRSSRGFHGYTVNASGVAFIPIVDLMNHDPAGTAVGYDAETSTCQVVAGRDLQPGDGVTFNYGPKCNPRLLVDYGFALDENPDDTVGLVFEERAVRHVDLERALVVHGSNTTLEAAVHAALARLDASPAPDGSSAWQIACARVRRAERRMLEEILATARSSGAPRTTVAVPARSRWSPLPERSIAPPTRDERAAAVARHQAWAMASGARFDAVEIVLDADGNSALRARRAIAKDETIVAVPHSLLLLGERSRLATWLALEAARADSSWRPFLDVLPVAFPDLPMFRADLDALDGTLAHQLAVDLRSEIVDSHDEQVSLADYAWASAVLTSRGVDAPFTSEPQVLLVPIVALMAHGRGDTGWTFEDATYNVIAERDFAPGDEITFDTGDTSNARLFVHRGVVLDANPHDESLVLVRGEPFAVGSKLLDAIEVVGGSLAALEAVVRDALARLDRHDAAGLHGLVRRSERRVLEALLAAIAAQRA